MKATGMVRCVDNLGRVVIPKELRRTLGINIGDPVEFYVEGDGVVVKKYNLAGDIDQILDNLVDTIQLKSSLITAEQHDAILAKITEIP